jgi:2,4-dienoyl-CoA reductase (NADPH2)
VLQRAEDGLWKDLHANANAGTEAGAGAETGADADAAGAGAGASPFAVYRVGDCLSPRRAHAAVIEGQRVAVSL